MVKLMLETIYGCFEARWLETDARPRLTRRDCSNRTYEARAAEERSYPLNTMASPRWPS
jgi:hypothetical protein